MAKLQQQRGIQALVACCCLIALALSAVLAEGKKAAYSKTEFEEWVARMQAKADSAAETTVEGVNFASLDSSDTKSVTVCKDDDKCDYRSVKKAIKDIPDENKGRTVIYVGPGIWKEHIIIEEGKGAITIQGSGMKKTKFTYDLDAASAGGTLLSASFAVKSDDFIALDCAFENSNPEQAPGAVDKQAVAFVIAGDKGVLIRCAFLGFQDTLYDRYGRHYYLDCYIRGSIDYIFGDAQSFFDHCYLDSQASSFGSLTAQKRQTKKDDTGYVFYKCQVQGTGYLYLGRAWGPYSTTVFIETYFANIIRPEGWFNWGIPDREKTVFYGEYKCFGPGANRKGREPWSYELSSSQVQPFITKEKWIGAWSKPFST